MLTNTIALSLIQYIVDNNLPVGTKLPSIRELASMWDSNPSQVRTGLITLAALGVIDMHPRAGSFVKRLSSADLDNLFVLFFRLGMLGKQEDTINLYSIKAILDREIFVTAIKYRTDNDLYDLEENLGKQTTCFADCKAFVELDEQFHLLLAKISRNTFLVFLLEAIQGMLRPYRAENFTPEICRESWQSHRSVFEAIKAQDVAGAESIAFLHTEAGKRRFRARKEASGAQDA